MGEERKSLFVAFVNDGRAVRRPDLSSLKVFGEVGVKMVKAYNDYFSRFNGEPPYQNCRTVLLQMAIFAKSSFVDFTDVKSVTDFLYGFRTYLFTTSNLRSNLPSRNNYWMTFRRYIQFLMLEGVIAKGLIPPGSKKLNNRSLVRESQLIEKINSENPYDEKSIISINLSLNDEEYLDELESKFIDVKEAFLSASLREINEIKKAFNYGKTLAKRVNWESLQKKIELAEKKGSPYHDFENSTPIHLFRQNHPEFISNVLCYIKNKHHGLFLGYENCGLDSEADDALKYIHRACGGISASKLGGYLGRVTTRMLTPFFVYFLIRYPSFRVYSLLDAEIEGKSSLMNNYTSVGENSQTLRFTIDKLRAHDEKSGYLDDEAKEILQLLIELTTPFRAKLKYEKNPNYKKLWLVVNGGDSYGLPRPMNQKALRRTFGLNARLIETGSLARNDLAVAKKSFLASHCELSPYIGTATLKKLPPIQGILTWFESLGDSAKAATILGNTKKKTMESYIPKPIQHLMNIRMIRRFQNLIICAATTGKDYMLEATDFSSIDDVQKFLSDMLLVERSGGKDTEYSLTIKQILMANRNINPTEADRLTSTLKVAKSQKKIHISISADSLAALFLFEEHLNNTSYCSQNFQDQNSPSFWSELAKTLHQLLPNHPLQREFSSIYFKAMEKVDELRGKVTFPKVMS
ncbi:hypothetical protein [Pseudoalteromonas piscicida]|uniref:hypothetical protein n=1 Tax=Pseudoalteromonas piscicida TaxID=43662 RepID=UPI0032C086BE